MIYTRKNDFAKVFKYLGLEDTNLKIILLDRQNNYVEDSSTMSIAAKSFDNLSS